VVGALNTCSFPFLGVHYTNWSGKRTMQIFEEDADGGGDGYLSQLGSLSH
jgi:hypothetical protein